ncbi:MAG: BON domain-containing protein [Verrucomicrobiota bacterium]|nr:BON domain-containing protein [Verrucomicrobiota bacterium]
MKITNIASIIMLIASPVALLATPENDRKIEDSARASYNYRVILDDQVKVSARDGVVTLSGTVMDNDDRNLAVDTAESLPSVVRVNNQIKVESKYPEHSDSWMAFKIRGRLLVKAHVSAADTKVSVNEGHVTLTGVANSLEQKELTTEYAKDVTGVKSVTNDMTIKDKPDTYTVAESMDDVSISSQVRYALLSHSSTSMLKTKVTSNNGIVSISGVAKSDTEKALVTKLASNVRGVQSVTNDMTVAK